LEGSDVDGIAGICFVGVVVMFVRSVVMFVGFVVIVDLIAVFCPLRFLGVVWSLL